MDITMLVRILIVLTFLILAAGGPYALIKLRNFILSYAAAHKALEQRIQTLEQWRAVHEESRK